MAPTWQAFGAMPLPNVHVASVNCDENKNICLAENIQGYPTLAMYVVMSPTLEEHESQIDLFLYSYQDGARLSEYQGPRDVTSLADFATAMSA